MQPEISKMLESMKGLIDAENFMPAVLKPEDFDVTVKKFKPKSNCNKCYGRGYTGIQSMSRNYVLCKCLKKSMLAGAEAEAKKEETKAKKVKKNASESKTD